MVGQIWKPIDNTTVDGVQGTILFGFDARVGQTSEVWLIIIIFSMKSRRTKNSTAGSPTNEDVAIYLKCGNG
jgi:hypothetical protein